MDAVKVSDVIGEGALARREMTIESTALTVWMEYGDSEPRMIDTDVAAKLGFTQTRDIRKLIERIWPENQRPHVRATVARTSMPRGGEREVAVNAYWLTEAQILKVVARSETPAAESILDEMIRVYMLARRGLLAPVQPPTHDPALAAAVEALAREVKALKGKVASMGLPARQPPSKPAKALPSGGIDLASWRRKILSHVNVPGVLVTSSNRHGKSYGIPINELWQGALRIAPQDLPVGHTEALRSVMEGLGWEHVGPVTVGGRKEDVYLYVAPFGWKPRY